MRLLQPQGSPEIDWSNPLTRGLASANVLGFAKRFDAVRRLAPVHVGTKTVAIPSGLAAGFGSTLGAGTSDRIPTALATALTARSQFFRFRRNGAGGGSLGRLSDKTNGSAGQYFYYTTGSGAIAYGIYISGAETNLVVTGSGAANTWIDVLVTHRYTGTTNELVAYVNGNLVNSASVAGTLTDAASTVLSIGNRADAARNWDGLIECAYIWDRELSAVEAKALSNNRYQIFLEEDDDDDLFLNVVSAPAATYTLTAEAGSFALTGNPAGLLAARTLTANAGSFALTGNNAGLLRTYRLAADAGAFSLTGNPATLLAARKLTAAAGSFTLTGNPATLTYNSSAATYTLTAEAGSFALTGSDAGLRAARRLAAEAGAFALTGNDTTLTLQGVPADPRYARPDSDVSVGAWLPSTGSVLADMIDETTADSTDYIYTTAPGACEIALGAVTDPATSSGQVVRYQVWSPEENALTVRLKQGATTIASWTHASLPTTPTIYAQTLSAAECDSITDYADLRFEFTAA